MSDLAQRISASPDSRVHLRRGVYSILYPLARLLLRFGLNYRELLDVLKKAIVDAAADEGQIGHKKPTKSRVALLAGLSRAETSRLLDTSLTEIPHRPNPQARILGSWDSAPEWTDATGKPKDLDFEGPDSFSKLCSSHTTSYHPSTLLEEFESTGKIERLANGKLRLLDTEYSPKDDLKRLLTGFLAVNRLLKTLLNNLFTPPGELRFYQQTVSSRFIPQSRMFYVREMSKESARKWHKEFAALIDSAASNDQSLEGNTAGVIVVYFEEPLEAKGLSLAVNP